MPALLSYCAAQPARPSETIDARTQTVDERRRGTDVMNIIESPCRTSTELCRLFRRCTIRTQQLVLIGTGLEGVLEAQLNNTQTGLVRRSEEHTSELQSLRH